MSEYTFPFSTCEKPNTTGIAQPYSSLLNLINCLIIFYFLLKVKQNYTFILLFFILCFELFHVFSHSIHITGTIQINITHMLSYCINFAFPDWNASIVLTGSMRIAKSIYSSTLIGDTYGWDITNSIGISNKSRPDLSDTNPKTYIVDIEVFNNSGSSINWVINAIPSNGNVFKNRQVLENSSVVYTYF